MLTSHDFARNCRKLSFLVILALAAAACGSDGDAPKDGGGGSGGSGARSDGGGSDAKTCPTAQYTNTTAFGAIFDGWMIGPNSTYPLVPAPGVDGGPDTGTKLELDTADGSPTMNGSAKLTIPFMNTQEELLFAKLFAPGVNLSGTTVSAKIKLDSGLITGPTDSATAFIALKSGPDYTWAPGTSITLDSDGGLGEPVAGRQRAEPRRVPRLRPVRHPRDRHHHRHRPDGHVPPGRDAHRHHRYHAEPSSAPLARFALGAAGDGDLPGLRSKLGIPSAANDQSGRLSRFVTSFAHGLCLPVANACAHTNSPAAGSPARAFDPRAGVRSMSPPRDIREIKRTPRNPRAAAPTTAHARNQAGAKSADAAAARGGQDLGRSSQGSGAKAAGATFNAPRHPAQDRPSLSRAGDDPGNARAAVTSLSAGVRGAPASHCARLGRSLSGDPFFDPARPRALHRRGG